MDTQTLYGLKAAMALFANRPHDIIRIYYKKEQSGPLTSMLRWAASQRMVYRELEEEEMRKVAKSAHHEGIVLTTKPLCYKAFSPEEILKPDRRWMALDNVDNPHNLGAILRSCAFFGLGGVLVGGVEPESKVNSAALRVAEGGAEHLQLAAVPDLAATLKQLAARDWRVMGLETGSDKKMGRQRAQQPWMLVAGHEAEGLSADVRNACGELLTIPGSGRVGSLNVSVSVGVALALLAIED